MTCSVYNIFLLGAVSCHKIGRNMESGRIDAGKLQSSETRRAGGEFWLCSSEELGRM